MVTRKRGDCDSPEVCNVASNGTTVYVVVGVLPQSRRIKRLSLNLSLVGTFAVKEKFGGPLKRRRKRRLFLCR